MELKCFIDLEGVNNLVVLSLLKGGLNSFILLLIDFIIEEINNDSGGIWFEKISQVSDKARSRSRSKIPLSNNFS